ncbi:MAG: hypothetical protein ABEI86_12255, partial [Halobacteriaceae archaeon]
IEPRKIVDTIREPEYTGENRCIPCTIANVVIAAGISVAVALVSLPVAIVLFVLFIGVIYTRGYLIPGTPTITKRYFPDRVLRWFDKEPRPNYSVPAGKIDDDDIDVELTLRQGGVLKSDPETDDFILYPEFREQWYVAMDDLDYSSMLTTLAEMLGVPRTVLSTEDRGASYAVKVNDATAGKWESRQALLADMAAERVLNDRIDNWNELSVEHQSGLLRSLRVYLDRCPECGGSVTMTEETVESCCRSRQVIACNCDKCGVRLFEINAANVEGAAG